LAHRVCFSYFLDLSVPSWQVNVHMINNVAAAGNDRFAGCRGNGTAGWRTSWSRYVGHRHSLPQTVCRCHDALSLNCIQPKINSYSRDNDSTFSCYIARLLSCRSFFLLNSLLRVLDA